jgi:hypothetical protein
MQTAIGLAQTTDGVQSDLDNDVEIYTPNKTGVYSNDKKHHELYQKIMDFPLDNTKSVTSFSARLARDNVWSLGYAEQVIEEYRRFLFLMIASEHKVSPSDQIDQAWHLHMMFSHNYWDEFCDKTVQKKLHHWPDEGGGEYRDWYRMTINSYIGFFWLRLPENIWTDPDVRFKTRLCFIRIDREDNWVIPKLNVTDCLKSLWRRSEHLISAFI